jgi:hypothetical protein
VSGQDSNISPFTLDEWLSIIECAGPEHASLKRLARVVRELIRQRNEEIINNCVRLGVDWKAYEAKLDARLDKIVNE